MTENGTKPDEQDALAILTDEHLKAGLHRRRETLAGRLADIAVDEMMPDYASWPAEVRATNERNKGIYRAGIDEVDRRLKGAADLLRGPAPSVEPAAAAEAEHAHTDQD